MAARKPNKRVRSWRLGQAAALSVALTSSVVVGQTRSSSSAEKPKISVLGQWGPPHAERLLASPSIDERLLGVEHLVQLGTPQAWELLGHALLDGGAAPSTRERLALVQLLAERAPTREVQLLLVQLLLSAARQGRELDARSGASAALALAEAQTTSELTGLLAFGDPVATWVVDALVVYPPANFDKLLAAPLPWPPGLVRLGLHLDRERVLHRAHADWADWGWAGQVALIQELAELQDPRAARWARAWSGSELWEAVSVGVGALAKLHSREVLPKIAEQLMDQPRAPEWLANAYRLWPWCVAKRQEWAALPRPLWTALLLPEAAALHEQLRAAQATAELAQPAQLVLAQLPELLNPNRSAAGGATPPRSALQVQLLRAVLAQGQRPPRALVDSAPVVERAWAESWLDAGRAAVWLAQTEPAAAAAVLRARLEPQLCSAVARRWLMSEPKIAARFSAALLAEIASNQVPNLQLEGLLEEPESLPHAVLALAARDLPDLAIRAELWLRHKSPAVRAYAALGLAANGQRGAAGLLQRAYRFEAQALVRRALAYALASRRAARGLSVLQSMAKIDPDPQVRQIALQALRGILPSGEIRWALIRQVENEIWLQQQNALPPLWALPDFAARCSAN